MVEPDSPSGEIQVQIMGLPRWVDPCSGPLGASQAPTHPRLHPLQRPGIPPHPFQLGSSLAGWALPHPVMQGTASPTGTPTVSLCI